MRTNQFRLTSMIRHFTFKKVAIASVLLLTACSTTKEAPAVSSDGLALVESTRSTVAYVKEGIDFSTFDKLVVLPSTVAFRKDWKRSYNFNKSISVKITDEDMLKIRTEAAALFDEVFTKELTKSESFTLIDKPEIGSLFIKPAIINLELTSPELDHAPIQRQINRSSGEATLYLEIFDGVSGEILLRIIDAEQVGSDSRAYRVTNKGKTRHDAKVLVSKWASALREKFDEVHKK